MNIYSKTEIDSGIENKCVVIRGQRGREVIEIKIIIYKIGEQHRHRELRPFSEVKSLSTV